MKHFINKLRSTIHMSCCLILARTFGRYKYSVYDPCGLNFVRYHWRGKDWAFPTGPIDEEEERNETENY